MGRMTELLARKAVENMGGGAPDGELPPFVTGLLSKVGITPEAIAALTKSLKDGIEEIQINTRETRASVERQEKLLHEIAQHVYMQGSKTDPAGDTSNMTPAPDLIPRHTEDLLEDAQGEIPRCQNTGC